MALSRYPRQGNLQKRNLLIMVKEGAYFDNGVVQLYQADTVEIPLPDQSVHCVVTSPPYWGLRDYGLGPT